MSALSDSVDAIETDFAALQAVVTTAVTDLQAQAAQLTALLAQLNGEPAIVARVTALAANITATTAILSAALPPAPEPAA